METINMRCLIRIRATLIVVILTVSAGLHSVQAQSAFEPSSTPVFKHDSSHPDGGAVNLGMLFTPNRDITVDALGFYEVPNPKGGIVTGDEEVAIYDAGGTLLKSVDVTSSDPVSGGYFWAGINPLTLSSGQTYTVDANTVDYSNWWGYGVVPIVNSDIAYAGHKYDYTTSLAFPTQTPGEAADAYYGPNLRIVPEPSILGLLAVGAVGLFVCRRMDAKNSQK